MTEDLTIGRLAEGAGVNVETIRYYQRRGLLPEPSKPLGGHRRYTGAAVRRVRFIKRAQQRWRRSKGFYCSRTGRVAARRACWPSRS